MSLRDDVRAAVTRALERAAGGGAFEASIDGADVAIDRPKRPEHGDFATNAPLALAKRAGVPPRQIAEALVLALSGDAIVESAEVAGPGFVNLRVRPAALHEELRAILALGRGVGRLPSATGERIHVEYVSANPTGPLTVASARNAVLGDAVARLLEATGHRVTREYYVNDHGNQVRAFAASVRAAKEGAPPPEDGYKGAYVADVARALAEATPGVFDDDAALARAAVGAMLRGLPGSRGLPGLRATLARLGATFDVWFSEESLHRWGHVEVALERLRRDGFTREAEGALWFVAKGDAAVDDKDRVIRKSTGEYTYFASDIAYHADKIGRGYDRLVAVLGADHHGYVGRIRNVLDALGMPGERFEALLYQLVFVHQGGELVKSSKRAGNVVTADELMDEIDRAAGRAGAGRDALRFFFLSRAATTQVDLDVELAKRASLDNPVFYVQYGHARLCSLARKAEELGFGDPSTDAPLHRLDGADELRIALRLASFGEVVTEAATLREPHRVLFYVQELAREFQSYFTRGKEDPILPPESARADAAWRERWDTDRTLARLAWIASIRAVYAAALELLGVAAPERMDLPGSTGDVE